MSRTEFNKDNKDFTERAHHAAREQVYPHLFTRDPDIEFENVDRGGSDVHDILDQQLGVDVRLHVEVPQLGQPVPIHVQERFRRPEYRDFQDITITKFNNASGKESEISKIAAQYLIYGYFEGTLNEVQEAVCVNIPVLLRRIAAGCVDYGDENSNDKKQDFVDITFDELDRVGALAFHLDRTNSAAAPVIVDERERITAWSTGDI
jgi:hypothetical protein